MGYHSTRLTNSIRTTFITSAFRSPTRHQQCYLPLPILHRRRGVPAGCASTMTRLWYRLKAQHLEIMLDTRHGHVSAVCRSAYNYYRQLRPVVGSLSVELKHRRLLSRHVSSRLDCCNSLLLGINGSRLSSFKLRATLPLVSWYWH